MKSKMRKKSVINVIEKIIISCIFSLFAFLTWKISKQINFIQPTPYIDEIFHVPQMQLFCRNLWSEWDSKITTLPGLYLISYVLLKPLNLLNENACNVYSLRLINFIGTLFNFLLAYKIMSKLSNLPASKSIGKIMTNVVSALNIATFPPLYFFTFLYYTDVWGVTMVLLMYNEHISHRKLSKLLTAFFGLMAVMMRQTNIIWVGFIVMCNGWNAITSNMTTKKHQDYKFTCGVMRQLRLYFNSKSNNRKGKTLKSLFRKILSTTFPCAVVCVLFIIFVIINGGIVVGDKAAHTTVFHPMQILYFLDVTAFFGLPYYVYNIASKKKLPNMYAIFLAACFAIVISEINKLEHPYLLSDNRHLAFYIWKKFFGHDIMRRLICPTYGIAGFILLDLLSCCNFMLKVFLTVCICLNLFLQHLFELRYFIIPFIMCRLHFRQNIIVWLECIYFCVINAFTIYIFHTRTFYWASEPNTVQRFIW